MDKNEYLCSVEYELSKYKVNNASLILEQAQTEIANTPTEKLVLELGTPRNYVIKLLNQNHINPSYAKKHNKSFGETIFAFIFGIIILILIALFPLIGDEWIIFIFNIILVCTIIGGLFKISTAFKSALALGLLIIMYNAGTKIDPILLISLIMFAYAALIIVQSIVLMIVFIVRFILDHKYNKNYKITNYANIEVSEDALRVKTKFASKNVYVHNDINEVNIYNSFGETTIDASKIEHDLDIYVVSKFGEVNLILPFYSSVFDYTDISMGENKIYHINKDGVIINIYGKIKFGSLKY